MPAGRDYSRDIEFTKLCARRADADLTLAALELARDADDSLEFADTLAWIDAVAAELSGPLARARTEVDMLNELADAIAERHGITGDPAAYQQADGSYLPQLIANRRGIPISLCVLYIAVAGRLGIDLYGVAAPAHYLARYESVDGPLFIDAFDRGRVLRQDECVAWLQELTRLPRHRLEPALKPASVRTTIIRMLNNLKGVHVRLADWEAAWRVQHRLSSLQPASYAERRDLAVMSLRADKLAEAVDLLKSCLSACPDVERETLDSLLQQANAKLARWN